MNNDMFEQSEKMSLTLEDYEIKSIIESKETKIYHGEEYYPVKDLMSQENLFTHPQDLIIEEDNTWGHYDIIYNDTETSHEPRFFYHNNIAQQVDAIKYSENNAGYTYRLESLLESLAEKTLKKNAKYLRMFECIMDDLEGDIPVGEFDNNGNYTTEEIYVKTIITNGITSYKYYEYREDVTSGKGYFVELNTLHESENVFEFIKMLANKIADYLLMHNAQIEHGTIYEFVKDRLENVNGHLPVPEEDEADIFNIIREYTGYLYEEMIHEKNANEIYRSVKESLFEYFEINNEVIIDTQTRWLYIKKNRLEHFYNTAHGFQQYTRTFPAGTTTLPIPFTVTKDDVYDKDYFVEIQTTNSSENIEVSLDAQKEAQESVGYSYFVYPTNEENNNFLSSYRYLNISAKLKDQHIDYPYPNENFDSKNLVIPEDFDFSSMDTISLYDIPDNISWDQEYNASEDNPLSILFTQEDLKTAGLNVDLDTEISNLIVSYKVVEKGIERFEPLTYFTDYTYDVAVNPGGGNVTKTIRLYKKITEPTYFRFTVIKPQKLIKKITWSVDNDITTIDLGYTPIGTGYIRLLKTCPLQSMYCLNDFNPEFNFISAEDALNKINEEIKNAENSTEKELAYRLKKFGYWLSQENESSRRISFNKFSSDVEFHTTKNFSGIEITADNINYQLNAIVIDAPGLPANTLVLFKKSNKSDGNLSIRFYYKLRRINDRFLSGYQSNWTTSDPLSLSFILNKPIYQHPETGLIEILSKNGVYSNGETYYYEFFDKMIREIVNSSIGAVEAVDEKLEKLELWRNNNVDPYLKFLQSFSHETQWIDKDGETENIVYGAETPGGMDGELLILDNPEDYKKYGVGKAIIDLIDKMGDLNKRVAILESTSDIYIGESKPAPLADGGPAYKVWINTAEENGNGVIYYYRSGAWMPVSSVWSPPDNNNHIK